MPSTISYLDATLGAFPLPATQMSLLKNPDFNEPFTGDPTTGWTSAGGWSWNSLGFAEGNGGEFFYQKLPPGALTIGANYKLLVGVTAFSGNQPLKVLADSNILPAAARTAITDVGTYEFTFNASVATDQFYLSGLGVTCQVDYFRLIRI